MSQAFVDVRHLVKVYPGQKAASVDAVNFTLEKGEMLALLGPSGCGKTTILRMIAGLIEPTSGSIIVDGREIANVPVHRRGIGMVFQAYALFPHMSVEENVSFGLEMRKVPHAERQQRVRQALELVKLAHLADRRITQLSGGQQQRIAIARSLVIEPSILLLDEPLSNLDAKLRDEMRSEIREIQSRTGTTTIFVTHDQEEALSLADRIAVMSAGRIEQIGAPRDIYDRPTTHFVADFIGSGNFVNGTVVQAANGKAVVEVSGLGTIEVAHAGRVHGKVELLIRPHRIEVGTGGAAGSNRFHGIVRDVLYTGEMRSLTVDVGGLSMTVDSLTRGSGEIQRGDSVGLSVSPDDVTVIAGEAAR